MNQNNALNNNQNKIPNNMAKDLTVTPEEIAAQLAEHPEAEVVLRALFPDYFDNSVDVTDVTVVETNGSNVFTVSKADDVLISVSTTPGDYLGVGFILSNTYDWIVATDSNNMPVLVPVVKQ